ncbi:DnaB-like helicase C-terminal domain-containing protein [uncultured Corynebacterium sp.]|uniref:DnaB-like helicase C-terminal domain-containing protein n=1 Tax=uncultured Corynebacterium sp. TaxID=159447 RepID=UPI0025E403AF|nr:DnaB-like helicase C-terminal domain-containing protein [uncultured Corynebacterium sp.]
MADSLPPGLRRSIRCAASAPHPPRVLHVPQRADPVASRTRHDRICPLQNTTTLRRPISTTVGMMIRTPPGTVRYAFPDLDKITGGMRPGQLIVIASRPGAGKTTLLLQLLREAAFRQRRHALLLSGEMSGADIRLRLLSGESGVPMLTDRSATQDTAIAEAEKLLAGESLEVYTQSPLDTFDLDPVAGGESILGSLSPSDVGVIGVDCIDVIGPDTTNRDHERSGEADIHVVKNRMGPIAVVRVAHQMHRARFVPLG